MDDGSTDHTPEVLAGYGGGPPGPPRTRCCGRKRRVRGGPRPGAGAGAGQSS
ncbi:hypothetical protein QJS66_07855 [Kocuria rhizophila]|nr:hypothetical protein QJS66_07855 [Kocuria rhizophila]